MFKELDRYEFDKFAHEYIPYTPYQTSSYANTMQGEGYKTYFVGYLEDNKIKAASMIMIQNKKNFKYAYAPRGFLLDYKNKTLLEKFTNEVKKFLSSKGVIAIKLNPMIVKNIYDSNYKPTSSNPDYNIIFDNLTSLGYTHLGYTNNFETFKPRYNAIIDINKDCFTLFKNMHKNFRTKVRNAEANGVRIYKGDINELKILYDQIKGKYPRSLNYFEHLYESFGNSIELYYAKIDFDAYLKVKQAEYLRYEKQSQSINSDILKYKNNRNLLNKKMVTDKLLNTSKLKLSEAIEYMNKHTDGKIVATCLVIKDANMVTMISDAYDKAFTSFNAKHLLIWKLMEQFSNEGYKYFNLGGITSNNSAPKYKGLNEYKLGFGSMVYEYIGDFRYIINKPLYLIYKNTLFKK